MIVFDWRDHIENAISCYIESICTGKYTEDSLIQCDIDLSQHIETRINELLEEMTNGKVEIQMKQLDFEDACESFIKDLMYYHYGELTYEALDGVMEEVHGVVDSCRVTIRGDIAMKAVIEGDKNNERKIH